MPLSLFAPPGDLFDIKDFHAWILKAGPVPLYIMDELNDRFIQQIKQQAG